MSSALIKDFLKSSVSILQVVRPVNTQFGELPDWGLGVWLKLLISHLPWSFLGCSHQRSHCVPKNLSSELYKKIFSLKGWANVRIKTTHSRDGVGKGQVRRGSCLQLSICSKKTLLNFPEGQKGKGECHWQTREAFRAILLQRVQYLVPGCKKWCCMGSVLGPSRDIKLIDFGCLRSSTQENELNDPALFY